MQRFIEVTGTEQGQPDDSVSFGKNGKSILSILPCVLLCAFLLTTLTACESEDVSDLHTYVKQVNARTKGRIPPLPAVKSYETYTYDESKLRDPFTPTTKTNTNSKSSNSENKPDMKRAREVLEEFPLDTLKMVGALEQGGERWALIKSGDGTLYRTRKGHYIGQNFGRINRITETTIEISETVQDGLDGWVKRQTTLSVTE